MTKKILLSLWHFLMWLTPQNRAGDIFIAYIRFFLYHHRLPKQENLFNDALFRIKTGKEIRSPLHGLTSDKELVKLFIRAVVGDSFNVPTIGVLHSKADVTASRFPERCCIKPTHSSGDVIIRKNGERVDLETIKSWFDRNYYLQNREANYKFLIPKVIIEPLLFDCETVDDIKFFCYQGRVKMIQWDFDRHTHHTRRLYTPEWGDLNASLRYPVSEKHKEKPKNLSEMLVVAEKLAAYFSFVRVDMYTDGTSFFVGEITHCHGNAGERFFPRHAETDISRIVFG